ncbi:MAG TPA: ABC transporter permease [Chloroflexi bacterium]|nr:ABC transporter permease [Chloroflexota bacterium]
MIKWYKPRRRPLLRQPVVLVALGWLVLVGGAALLAPWLALGDPVVVSAERVLLSPKADFLLGTDMLGRDVLARLVWGGRWTLGMGLVGLGLAVGLGLPVGLVSGTVGGWLDVVLMRMVDGMLAFPGLLLAMATIAVLGRSIISVAVAVGLAAAPAYARVARSATREVRAQPYVDAARAIGSTEGHVMVRHVLPNVTAPLLAFAATQLGWILLNGAALNFLGLGVELGTPEWGAMLADGRGYLRDGPWASAFPGLALTLTVLAVNLLADGVQEATRPR